MYLRADSMAGDMWNLLGMVLTYIAWDVARLFKRPSWHEWLGMVIRLALLWALLPLALLPAIVSLLLCGNYLGLLSHALPVGRGTTDPVLRQLRTTWDLYPGSFVASLVTGGLNAHATHHVYPTLPRGAQPMGTRILRDEAGMEHRCVDTLSGLWTLFRLRRFCTAEVATIGSISAGRLPSGLLLLHDIRNIETDFGAELPREQVMRGHGGPDIDRRVDDRRRGQVTISFPDRRRGGRRGASAAVLV